MITLKNIEKSFGENKVLDNVNLSVDTGDVVALIGPSGTGKTTLLRAINFLSPADKGLITIGDLTIDSANSKESERLAMRRKTAMVFQNYSLFKNRTVLDNVTEGLRYVQGKSAGEAEKIAKAELSRVGMIDKLAQYPSELSGGQQQRVGIARALALQPEVILLDEPTSSLDPERSAEILQILQEVTKTGITMIIATHEMAFAKYISNKVVFMENGLVVEEGTPEQIFQNPENERTRDFVVGMENPLAQKTVE